MRYSATYVLDLPIHVVCGRTRVSWRYKVEGDPGVLGPYAESDGPSGPLTEIFWSVNSLRSL